MSIVDRIKNICLTPNTEWPVIASEPSSTGSLMHGYVAPLAAVGASRRLHRRHDCRNEHVSLWAPTGCHRLPWACRGRVVGHRRDHRRRVWSASSSTRWRRRSAPNRTAARAMKVAVYSFTPAWVAGVLRIIPALGVLAILGAFYGFYLLYLGLPALMKAPKEKAAGYTVVTIVARIRRVCRRLEPSAVSMVGGRAIGTGCWATSPRRRRVRVPARAKCSSTRTARWASCRNSARRWRRATRRWKRRRRAATRMPRQRPPWIRSARCSAAGKKVDPLEIDQMKSFLPPTLAGFSKQGNGTAEKSGFASLMVSKAEANYSDGSKTVNIGISDSGGASGIMGLAGWAALQTSKEDDNGSERVSKVNGRLVHEQTRKNGEDEFDIILGDRFVVSASSRDVKLNQLKAIVSALDLNKIESMKDVGVKK